MGLSISKNSLSIKKNGKQSQATSDISKYKRLIKTLNSELKETKTELGKISQILLASPDPILITDEKASIIYANPAWEKTTGYKLKEVLGKNPKILQSGKTPPHVFEEMWQRLSKGKPYMSDEIVDKKKDGTLYQIHSTIFPLKKGGSIIGYFQTHLDITRHKQFEEELKASEKQYRLLFELNPVPMFIYSVDTLKFLAVNEAAVRLYGYSKKEFLSIDLTQIRPKEEIPNLLKFLDERKAQKEEKPIEEIYEVIHQKKDGSIIIANTSRGPITFKGKPAILVMIQDITKKKQDAERIRESEEKYRKLIELANDAIFLADAQTGIIIDANLKAQEMVGLPRKKLIGIHQFQLHPPKEIKRYQKIFKDAIEKGTEITEPLYAQHSSGKLIPIEISSSVVEVNNKKIILGIFRDISERKRIEDLKTEFLSVASHELKTPITTLKLMAQGLKMRRKHLTKEDESKYLDLINKEVDRLTVLINKLLDVSRIETGKFYLEKEKMDMALSCKEVIGKMKLTYPNRKIHFPKLPPIYIRADKSRIEEVLINLISNAIRYSKKDVKVNIKTTDGELIVSVSDKGKGIPEIKKSMIFNKFYQIKSRASGFGLGLYISKEIVTHHRGRIWLTSKEGLGTTFYFSLPLSLKNNKNN